MVEFRKSIIDDALILSKNLRHEDIEELELVGSTPLNALLSGFIFSKECYTVVINGEVSGMFGIGEENMPDNWASIWFLGNDEVLKHKKVWIVQGKNYINKFLEKYKILANRVDVRNKKHIYWLKKMGAVFLNITPVNDGKMADFIIFKRGQNV